MPRRLLSPFRRLLERLGGVEPVLFLLLAAIAAGTWAFVELADEVLEGDTLAFDRRIVLAFRTPGEPNDPLGPAWVEEAMRDFTGLGGFAVLILVTIAVCGFLALLRRRHMMVFMGGAAVGGLILSSVLKAAFERPRPDFVAHLSHVITSSFPSGHSMMSAVVYLTLGALLSTVVARKRLKLYLLGCAVGVSALVGLSRVYLGVHYPTDVLAGWTVGLVWAALCALIARILQRRGAVEAKAMDAPEADDAQPLAEAGRAGSAAR